jgi:hypothetical protein
VRANARAVGGGLNLWLALHDDRFCALTVDASEAASGAPSPLPSIYGRGDTLRTSVGLLDRQALALLGRRAEPTGGADEWSADAPSTELEVYSFGAETGLAERLQALVRDWDVADRPTGDRLSVRAYRRAGQALPPNARQVVIKDWSSLVLDWS